jgi:putative membrane protein
MNRINLVAALTVALAVPTAARAEEGPDPADLLGKLHHSNQMEIEAGKLAQEKGTSKEVKAYGKALVRDHTAADKKVMATAKQLKVELPKDMPPMKNDKLEAAKAATGPEFDKKFAEAMLEDHKKDVEEATEARDKTTNPKLKKLLAGVVPTLEKHRDTAQKIVDGAEKK